MRKSLAWSALAIIVVSGALPVVLGQVETAPTLSWTRSFAGTLGSGQTLVQGQYHTTTSTQETCTNNDQRMDVDWQTGRLWVAYVEGSNSESGGHKGAYAVLNPNTGGSAIAGSVQLNIDGGKNAVICGIALDQRGRAYFAAAPCLGTTYHVPSFVLDRDGDALKTFTAAELCGSGVVMGFYTDRLTDVSVNGTRVVYSQGTGGKSITSSNSDTTTYNSLCNAGITFGSAVISFRDDGVLLDRYWYNAPSFGSEQRNIYSTCAAQGTATSLGSYQAVCRTTSVPDLACTRLDTGNLELAHLDLSDVTGDIGFTSADIDPPDPYDDGLSTQTASQNPQGLHMDRDGDFLTCGGVTGSGAEMSYLAMYNGAWDTLLWNITIARATFDGYECDLGPSGEIYWFGTLAGSPSLAQVRKYCCNNNGVEGSQEIIEQIVVPEAPATPTPGSLFNIDGNTIPGVGAFGANLFFGVLMIAGMTVSMGASPMAFTSDRSFRFSVALAVIGAILGFFMAWAFGFLSNSAVFVVVILAIVVIGFYVVRKGG